MGLAISKVDDSDQRRLYLVIDCVLEAHSKQGWLLTSSNPSFLEGSRAL